ncbi:hypothetical protein ACPA54_27380 [Uniformispora flossi]
MSGAGVVTGAVCAALTGLCFVWAVRSAQRGGYLKAARWVGIGLLPIGMYLTGLATLGRRVGSALTDWATNLAFGIQAWAGVAILAVGVSILLVVRMVGARRGGAGESRPEARAGGDTDWAGLAGLTGGAGRSLPTGQAQAQQSGGQAAAGRQPKPAKQKQPRRGRDDTGLGNEFAEIEEILKRRGI